MESPLDLLYSSDEDADSHTVRSVRVADMGSRPKCVKVAIQGVPAFGVVDSGADITIMGGDLFKKVAAGAKLRKRDFRKSDKSPRTYNRQPFTLDGRMDLNIQFDDKVMTTPYIKMDAVDTEADAIVPMVTVRLIKSLHLPSHQGAIISVNLITCSKEAPVHVDPLHPVCLESSKYNDSLSIEGTLLCPDASGQAHVVVKNSSGYTEFLEEGTDIGLATPVTVVECSKETDAELVGVNIVHTGEEDEERKAQLAKCIAIECPEVTEEEERRELLDVVTGYHKVFSLSSFEREETDLVEFKIDTGEARPRKLPLRRMPFTVREEVARQVQQMQDIGVITPSNSPWSCPVVLVRKKDGSQHFCVDHCQQ